MPTKKKGIIIGIIAGIKFNEGIQVHLLGIIYYWASVEQKKGERNGKEILKIASLTWQNFLKNKIIFATEN